MSSSKTFSRFGKFIQDHSPTILTALGVAGTVATAYLAGRASFKASLIIRDNEERDWSKHLAEDEKDPDGALRRKIQRRLIWTWDLYVPAVSAGVITSTTIVLANRIGERRTAALAAAYAIMDRSLSEYRDKVREKLGPKREQGIRDEIAKDRITKHPFDNLVIVGEGSVICYDAYTGRYFMSDMETLRRAENDINHNIIHNNYASLSELYDLIGLARTSVSDDVGWNLDRLLELQYSTVLSEGGKPCISVDYNVEPIRGFSRLQ